MVVTRPKLSTLPDDMWVNVSWMPHSSLSQSSHVTFSVRSAHLIRDAALDVGSRRYDDEWRVHVLLKGMAGLDLVSSVVSSTAAATVRPRVGGLQAPTVMDATHECRWNGVLHVPIRWRDLPRDAYLHMTVVDSCDVRLYETTMALFDSHGRLHTGLHKLDMESLIATDDYGVRKNQGMPTDPTYNPGLVSGQNELDWSDDSDPVWKASRILDQLDRFEAQKGAAAGPPSSSAASPAASAPVITAFGQIQSVPWLDTLTKQCCHDVLLAASESTRPAVAKLCQPPVLIIELPTFDVPILHEETFYSLPTHGACGAVTPLDKALWKQQKQEDDDAMVPFIDYESAQDNPVEEKYRALAHDLLRGLVDPALKPDKEQRDRLATIIASPSHHPSREEKDLLWRFRFSLVENRKALTKFLLAVDWTVESEVVQAAELLEQWRKRSPIEVTDALKLLGKHVAFQTNLVRAYALDTLAVAPDDELRLYLLQLVQAIRWENTIESNNAATVAAGVGGRSASEPSLASFLIDRASRNVELANYLYWYLKVEVQDETYGPRYRDILTEFEQCLARTPMKENNSSKSGSRGFLSIVDSVSKLSSRRDGESDSSVRSVWDALQAQDEFVSGIMDLQMKSRDVRGKRDAKELALRGSLASEGFDRKLSGHAVPLPSAPHVWVDGVVSSTAKMFKSALYPALIEFRVDSCVLPSEESDFCHDASSRAPLQESAPSRPTNNSMKSYKVIVKTGDDLRQDQLVIMMIQLMDGLLKRGTLDLCLTPYAIIATGTSTGLMEFVDESSPISQVLASHNNSIMTFFQKNAPQAGAKYNVKPDVISNYVRSCAGYCVITYLLGVGDRHLDNIMLKKSGHFFHIDFGFIFGRDPKPLPPAFRLTREMVDGMGGVESAEYRQFCSLACQAYNTLRKSAGLVLNLLHLMSDAGIEDLSNNPSADTEAVIASVEQRFRLDLTDEQAERHYIGLINDSLAAIAPRVMDVFHSIAVARR